MLVVGPTPGRRRFELQEEAFVAHLTPSSDDRGLRTRVVVPVGREVPRIAHKNVEMQPQQTRRSDHHRQDRVTDDYAEAGDGERPKAAVGRRPVGKSEYRSCERVGVVTIWSHTSRNSPTAVDGGRTRSSKRPIRGHSEGRRHWLTSAERLARRSSSHLTDS